MSVDALQAGYELDERRARADDGSYMG